MWKKGASEYSYPINRTLCTRGPTGIQCILAAKQNILEHTRRKYWNLKVLEPICLNPSNFTARRIVPRGSWSRQPSLSLVKKTQPVSIEWKTSQKCKISCSSAVQMFECCLWRICRRNMFDFNGSGIFGWVRLTRSINQNFLQDSFPLCPGTRPL